MQTACYVERGYSLKGSLLPNRTFFHKGCSDGRDCSIEWVHVQNPLSKGLVFLPPLIGGNVSQQIRMFRWLCRKGYDLFSFNYSGHGNSADKFSFGASLRDTKRMLHHAMGLTKVRRIPLFGIAPCYSAIPLLHSAAHFDEPFKRIVLINAVLQFKPTAIVRSFFDYYHKVFPPGFAMRKSFVPALKSYLDFLFPEIKKGKTHFGILERRRIRLLKTVADFLTLNPLQSITLRKTSVLCLYGNHDRILKVYDKGGKENYRKQVRMVCPQTRFAPFDGDHFLTLSETRHDAVQQIRRFLQGNP